MTETILKNVADYYSAKLAEHGASAKGVDWNGEASQLLRFEQLMRIVDLPGRFSVNDIGCGYGALVDFMSSRGVNAEYHGWDISKEMIDACRVRHAGNSNATFSQAGQPASFADFGVASGIFNVKLDIEQDEWISYISATLDTIYETSVRGFAFNCLTSYSDAEYMQHRLYYANPGYWFEHCKRRYAKNVALLHDYGLYEFTILVRKQL
jgi:SAM-dependent methyltransferase